MEDGLHRQTVTDDLIAGILLELDTIDINHNHLNELESLARDCRPVKFVVTYNECPPHNYSAGPFCAHCGALQRR